MTDNPGSPDAIKSGCKCPRIDNCHGDGYRGNPERFVMREGCPVHGEKWLDSRAPRRADDDAGVGLAV